MQSEHNRTQLLQLIMKQATLNVDRGLAWVVLLGICIIHILIGIVYSIGIFNVVFLEVYQKDKSTTAWLGAAQSSLLSLFGPFAGFVNQKLGPRVTVMGGGLMASLGFFLTYFSTGYTYHFFTYSVLVGMGNAFVHLPSVVLIGFYFKKYRAIAFGLVSSMIGVGTIVLPLVINYCNEYYGWRGCMLIMAGIFLHAVPAGALLRKQEALAGEEEEEEEEENSSHNIDRHVKTHNVHLRDHHDWVTASLLSLSSIASANKSGCHPRINNDHTQKEDHTGTSHISLVNGSHKLNQNRHNTLKNEDDCDMDGYMADGDGSHCQTMTAEGHESELSNTNDVKITIKKESWHRVWKVLTDKYLVLLNINLALIYSSTFVVVVHFPSYFYNQGMTQTELSLLMMLLGLFSIMSRLLAGATTNNKDISILLIYFSTGGLSAIFILLCPILSNTVLGRVIFTLGFGFYGNAINSLYSPFALTLCGPENMNVAYSIMMLTCGISMLLGPPFAGWIYDVSGSYMKTFIIAGFVHLVGALILMLFPVIQHYDEQKDNRINESKRYDSSDKVKDCDKSDKNTAYDGLKEVKTCDVQHPS